MLTAMNVARSRLVGDSDGNTISWIPLDEVTTTIVAVGGAVPPG